MIQMQYKLKSWDRNKIKHKKIGIISESVHMTYLYIYGIGLYSIYLTLLLNGSGQHVYDVTYINRLNDLYMFYLYPRF